MLDSSQLRATVHAAIKRCRRREAEPSGDWLLVDGDRTVGKVWAGEEWTAVALLQGQLTPIGWFLDEAEAKRAVERFADGQWVRR